MKDRPQGFISTEKIDHNGEIFDYIKELHEYLWQFVHIFHPGAGGSLGEWIDSTLDDVNSKRSKV